MPTNEHAPLPTRPRVDASVLAHVALDRSSPVPLYHQLESAIRTYLDEERPTPGTTLPTEEDLVRHLGVSRSTVRQALGRLQRDGLVERRQAHGTTVAATPYAETLRWLDSFLLALIDEGRDVTSVFDPMERSVTPPPTVARAMDLGDDDRCHAVHRVIYVDGEPHNVASAFVAAHLAPDLCDDDLDQQGPRQSLYYVLRTTYGIDLESADVFVEPHALAPADARRLRRDVGIPALRRTRIVRARGGLPLLAERAVFVHGIHLTMPVPSPRPPTGGPS